MTDLEQAERKLAEALSKISDANLRRGIGRYHIYTIETGKVRLAFADLYELARRERVRKEQEAPQKPNA